MNKKKTKSLTSAKSLAANLAFLKHNKRDFKLRVSNYQVSFESDLEGFDRGYMESELDDVVFVGFRKILTDLKEWSANENPNTKPDECEYYDINKFVESGYHEKVYNVDLKAAYISILLNGGFIKQETYNFIMTLTKPNRLKALGMLASRNRDYIYQKGELVYSTPNISKDEGYFFYAVKETEKLMNYLRIVLGEDFIFSWVDGVYFKTKSYADHLIKEITNYGLSCTFQELTDFYIVKDKIKIQISFLDQKNKRKLFNIPIPESDYKKQLLKRMGLI